MARKRYTAEQIIGYLRQAEVMTQDEEALTADIIKLATQYGRYGYKRITDAAARGGMEG